MPKTKVVAKDTEKSGDEIEKIIEIEEEDAKDLDDELISGDLEDEELEDDELGLDEEEVDPFKDKWEE